MRKPHSDLNLPQMEESVLTFWETSKIFEKQNENRKNAPEFSFYDGPPFANGLPHYGHILATTIKDVVCRYWVMKGYQIDRRFGWDCHGLPVEFEIEKRENLKGRLDILKKGVAQFNELCRDSVLFYTKEWQKTITRLGRWVDWNHQYRTMDPEFMESVWWVFKTLYDKGLVYRGFKVVPYSPRTSSVVSNFEANQNYKNVQDPSIIVKFKTLKPKEFFLAWTTTPWTLPSNLALAVHPDFEYVRLSIHDEIWILAKDRLSWVLGSSPQSYEILETFLGVSLKGSKYEPLFPYFQDTPQAFQLLCEDFVTGDTGTGLVHQAPAYGEDDFLSCEKANISLVDPIDENGFFTAAVPDLEGQFFKDADKQVIRKLKEQGLLLRQDTLVHSYPFDERTDTPLMYKAVPSWYVAVEKIKDDLVASNQTIQWVPSHLKDGRMGTWLSNARDWAISRNRFWGTPLPVWICSHNDLHREVFQSRQELEERAQKPKGSLADLHLHHVEHVVFSCLQCQGSMKTVGLVFDCWFESGSMPYGQNHYPFENQERFKKIFPADFIAEGLDQTRGWFYTLNVLSNALFQKPAFKNVIVNGVILDPEGKKMSKRHRNYTPPDDLVNKFGADSVRMYLLHSPLLKGEDLIFQDQGVKEITRSLILPIWNAYTFLATYAEAASWKVPHTWTASEHPMDRWISSRLQSLLIKVEEHMNRYTLSFVVDELFNFVEDLTNWYIRLNRRRFWDEEGKAYETLFHVLSQLSKILAPFAPFTAESLFQSLHDTEDQSVHLEDFPKSDSAFQDQKLEKSMAFVRSSVNLGRSLRQQHKIKTRQVLSQAVIVTETKELALELESSSDFLKQELNIKSLVFSHQESDYVNLSIKPNLKTLGPKLGSQLKLVNQSLSKLSENSDQVWAFLKEIRKNRSAPLGNFVLEEADLLIQRSQKDHRLIATDHGITMILDPSLTPELIQEGLAREVINRIQTLRKDKNLNVSDRIDLTVTASFELVKAIEIHKKMIIDEVLALSLEIQKGGGDCLLKYVESFEIEGQTLVVALSPVLS